MKKQFYPMFAVCGILLFMQAIFNSCIQEETFAKATVETSQITSITEATATCGGLISADGGSEVTVRGVCWSTSPTPTIVNDTTIDAAGTGLFASRIKGLKSSTTYYVRAYAVNKGGTGYGLQMTFTTKTISISTLPISISFLTATSAISGGNIISDGDSSTLTVKARGVCWNTFPSPTIENSKSSDGVGGGSFKSHIDSLTAFTTYYVRAYATNGNGTIYGNELIFMTLSGVIGLTTSLVSSITAHTASTKGTITSDGGAPVSNRGICWNTISSPTTANSKTANGSGIGTFSANLTGLASGTTYYVRSYAVNSVGTYYGNEISFTTQSGIILLTTNNVSSISSFTATSGGFITSDGGTTITSRGICWSNSPNPTILNSKSIDGTINESFVSTLTGLNSSTTYFVRAYATNSGGTVYGNEVSFTTLDLKGTVTDVEGNVYNYITIGTQTWMVENLKTTKYNDGASIPLVNDAPDWLNVLSPGYCFYNNDEANKNKYGALYNWYTVNSGKLAPIGWHVPTDVEWTTLTSYLSNNGYGFGGSGIDVAKSLSSTFGWNSSSTIGAVGKDQANNNSSGFTAQPGGNRMYNGYFNYLGSSGVWWSSTGFNTYNAWFRVVSYDNGDVSRGYGGMQSGSSVRCIRN